MPLKPGSSKKTIRRNIAEFHGGKTYQHTLRKFGKARAEAQATAVAMSEARKTKSGIGRIKNVIHDRQCGKKGKR